MAPDRIAHGRRALIALVVIALAVGLAWWLRAPGAPAAVTPPSPREDPPRASAAPPEVASSTRSTARAASAAARAAAPPSPAPRTVLPRPAAPTVAPTGEPSAAPRRIRIAERGGPLRDRRDNPGPDAPSELELVHAGLDTVREDVEACLDEWAQTDAAVSGSVMIGFQLDESGLTESWVEGAAELPFGVQTCFGNAVYGVDWSHVVSHPAQITNRFEIEDTRDGGAPR